MPPAHVEAAPEGVDFAHVLDDMRREGPLVHLSTGIDWLDERTGGGPVLGSRWFLVGAPDGGKTGLVVQLADVFAQRGVAVGLHAVDEEPGDLVQRFAQRRGVSRRQMERRDPYDVDIVQEQLEGLPITFYDSSHSIESAAADLARRAGDRPRVLMVDSLQTVRTCDEDDRMSTREAVSARVWSIRRVSSTYKMLTMTTSEMGRAFYRSATHDLDELAAGKESGTVEYSARVVLALRSVEGESDLVELRLPKNKHGARTRLDERGHFLRLDRARQEFTSASDYTPETIEDQRTEAQRAQGIRDAANVATVLAESQGLVTKALRAAIRAQFGKVSSDRVDTAVAFLGDAIIARPGPRRAVLHFLDGSQVPESVINSIEARDRPAVVAARPPEEGCDHA